MSEPIYFDSPAAWRAWLEKHHDSEPELIVGFWKKGSGMPGMTWREAVGEALCFGWIDSIGRRVDDRRRTIRFTPRRPRSHWSAVNVARVEELRAAGLMHPAGEAAFAARSPERTAQGPNDAAPRELDDAAQAQFEAAEAAWEFFGAQPPGYRRRAIWWVTSAKREETRARRLAQLIDDSAAGRRIRQAA